MTTTPTDAQMKLVDVTQADRDLWKYLLDAPKSQCTMMDTCDPATDELQAIARHRQATEARAQGLVEALTAVHDDLLMRAEIEGDEKIVAVGTGVWVKVCNALATWRRT